MICTDKRLRLCRVLLVGILLFIWGNSLMPGEVSQTISNWVQRLFQNPPLDSAGNPKGNGIVRKIAHFTEFGALGLCLGWLGGMQRKRKSWPLLWGVAAACVDETIQAFVPDRAPGLRDVMIDSCGVLAGMVLLCLGHSYWKRRSTNITLEET